MKSPTRKTALGAVAALAAIAVAAALVGCQPQGAGSDGGPSAGLEAQDIAASGPGTGPYAKGTLSVGFYKTCSEYDAHAIVAERGGVWVRDSYVFANDLDWASALVFFPQCDSFDGLSEMAEEIRGLPEVKFVDFETEIPDDDLQIAGGMRSVEQAYLYYAKFDKAWDVVECDHDVTIAIIDRDFDLDHPDLAGDVLFAWDASTGAFLQTDRVSGIGHGTRVAGIISAEVGYYGIPAGASEQVAAAKCDAAQAEVRDIALSIIDR